MNKLCLLSLLLLSACGGIYQNTGSQQLMIGYGTPSNIANHSQTGVGVGALENCTANCGIDETAFGTYALASDQSGAEDTAMGDRAGAALVDGNNNTAIGSTTLAAMQHGTFNTAIGVSAMQDATGGIDNDAVGTSTLNSLTTGSNTNTAIGSHAGYTVIHVLGDSFFGGGTDSVDGTSYSTALGYGARITENHQIMLGTSAETVVIPGNLIVTGHITCTP